MKQTVKISVCIPVYNSELLLARCLESVFAQEFEAFEIVVVNDGSCGHDEQGKVCRKIVKAVQKSSSRLRKEKGLGAVNLKYIEHRKNLGLTEARRTAVENAGGEYICNVDSDDILLSGALEKLYAAAEKSAADIVHGKTDVYCFGKGPAAEKISQRYYETSNRVVEGELSGKDIFDSFIVKKNHTGLLWAKLIKRETYLKAFSFIPFSNCTMIEDLLQYFFISFFAEKYAGIADKVYCYTVDTGISSDAVISDLGRWEKICTAANVFTIIFDAIKPGQDGEQELALSFEQLEALKLQSRSYLVNNIQQLKKCVVPELQEQAYALLCEYWGENFVATMEKAMENTV